MAEKVEIYGDKTSGNGDGMEDPGHAWDNRTNESITDSESENGVQNLRYVDERTAKM